MSHEIRTPLSGVIGLSRLLETMSVPAEALEMVHMIRSSGDALLRVINDVLDFSKVEAGKLDLEVTPFNLHLSLEQSVGLFRAAAAEKGLCLACELAPELPAWVAGDDTRLRQVVLNLVSNALKFTGAGEVILSARVEREFATPVLGLQPNNCLACSRRLIRRTPPSAAVMGGPAWAWQSRNGWSS